VVEGLRGDLAGMVHPHQAGCVTAGLREGHRFRAGGGGIRPGRHVGGRHRAEGPVELPDQAVDQVQAGAGAGITLFYRRAPRPGAAGPRHSQYGFAMDGGLQ